MAKRNFIPLVPSGTINADASVAQLEQDVLAMDAKVGELAEDIGDTEQEINQLKSAINEVEASFPQKSASGSIVTIDDGADNVPVVSLEAEINPVQDLHGYENPWPAGGSKNRVLKIITNANLGADGIIITDSSFDLAVAEVTSGETYTFSVNASMVNPNIAGYFSTEPTIGSVTTDGTRVGGVTATFTATQTAYMVLRLTTGGTKVQLEVGSTWTPFVPYSNICPISGFTGANIFDTGVNVWDEEWELGAIVNGNNYSSTTNIRSKNYIAVVGNTSYYSECSAQIVVFQYDSNKTLIGTNNNYPYILVNARTVFTTFDNAKYLRFYTQSAYGTSYNNDISINYPSTDHEYHAYNGRTVNISWETEAGTVYGGSLVLNQDGTADLVDKYRAQILNGDSDIEIYPIGSTGHYRIRFYATGTKEYATSAVFSGWCDTYKPISANATYQMVTGVAIQGGSSSAAFIYDPQFDVADITAATVKAYLAEHPVKVVYELAEPVTYHLTDVDLVKTLYGLNNLWADTGDIDLVYRADSATYTAEQIRIMLNAMVAPVEQSTTASKAYSVNEFLIYNNVLYKVDSPIANGGTITIGTNVHATTVGAELTAILNS